MLFLMKQKPAKVILNRASQFKQVGYIWKSQRYFM